MKQPNSRNNSYKSNSVWSLIISIGAFIIAIICWHEVSEVNTSSRDNLAIEERFGHIENDVSRISNQVSVLEWVVTDTNTAIFSPKEEGFQKIETGVGDVYVSLENITPYADGYKVTFTIGNPSAANILNARASLSYGSPFNREVSYEAWRAGLKQVEKKIQAPLKPSTWNKVTFVISPAKADETGYLLLKLQATGLSLYLPK
jgi:hypothetical protein